MVSQAEVSDIVEIKTKAKALRVEETQHSILLCELTKIQHILIRVSGGVISTPLLITEAYNFRK